MPLWYKWCRSTCTMVTCVTVHLSKEPKKSILMRMIIWDVRSSRTSKWNKTLFKSVIVEFQWGFIRFYTTFISIIHYELRNKLRIQFSYYIKANIAWWNQFSLLETSKCCPHLSFARANICAISSKLSWSIRSLQMCIIITLFKSFLGHRRSQVRF